jgi:hypothetical protein
MSDLAVVMMTAICLFVWGGFAAFLTYAIRSEGRKRGAGD